MNWFSRLEKISGKLIEGIFKTKFAGPLQPVEIARALAREMGDRRKVSVSHTYVPNHFEVQVSPGDWEQINAVQETIIQEIRQFLQTKAQENNYSLIQRPEINFTSDESIESGDLRIISKFTENPEAGANLDQSLAQGTSNPVEVEHTQVFQLGEAALRLLTLEKLAGAELVVLKGNSEGMKYRLGKGVSTLGRRENNDIFLDDANISRVHARIERSPQGYLLIDMGSLNGTYVNNQRLNQTVLQTGDQIKMGSTELEFRVV